MFGRWQARTDHDTPSSPEAYHQRSLSTHSSSSSISTQSPIPFSASPPPTDATFAKYHVCNDRRSEGPRLPSLPVADLHQRATGTTSWGVRLPPLKAIMNEYDTNSTPLVPLLLPPPTPYY